jgi:integrase
LPIDTIETSDVEKLLEQVYVRAPIEANRQFSLLRRFFGWAVRKRLVTASPCAKLEKPAAENEGERTLDEDEIRLFWSATETKGLEFRGVFRLLLITAQRESEVGKMRGREVDLGKRLWVIPPERTKNKKGAHEVALSDLAVEILEPLLHEYGDGLVFPSVSPRKGNTGKTAISGYSKAKARIDKRILELLRLELEKAGKDASKAEIEDWVLHDLRRTVATQMAEMGIAPQVVDRGVLNHQSGVIRGVARIYNRYKYQKEAREALLAWGERLRTIVGAPEGALGAPRSPAVADSGRTAQTGSEPLSGTRAGG